MANYMNTQIYNVLGEPINMIFVEGGTSQLGTHNSIIFGQNCTIHTATLKDFFIGDSLVTERLYSLVIGHNYDEDASNYPASLGIHEVLYFIFRLNQITGIPFRLPTLDEWEYAAKGGKKSNGYRYSGSDNLDDVGWYEGNSSDRKHPIKMKKPNELGIFDMSGNMLEYCACNTLDFDPNSWNNLYRIGRYNFELYRGGCYGACQEQCEINYLDDWAQDWYECRGLRLCISATDAMVHE